MSSSEAGSTTQTSSGLAAEIITTGSELLLGEIVDTNAAWIAQQLRDAGVNLYYKTTVGDNEARLTNVLELSLSRSDVLIVTGGLGPTVDDITRQAIAAATNRSLYLDEGALETLKRRFERFGVQMTDNNRQQALIPDGATLIENPVGTAPGFIVHDERGDVIALPGVPREMKHLMTETVLPYLRERSGHAGIIVRRVLRTIGVGESTIDSRISELMQGANPSVGLAAHTGQVDVRITARAQTQSEADSLLDEMEAKIRDQIGEFVYSQTPGEKFEAMVAQEMQRTSASVALLETNTQGVVARRLTTALADYDPVTAYWRLHAETESAEVDDIRDKLAAGSEFGESLAVDCARSLLANSSASFGLAILGTADEDQGVFGRSQGQTWFALVDGEEAMTGRAPFAGKDDFSVVRIGNLALMLLWNRLRA